jgi:flagellar hook-associated protein 1 FlgK
MGLLTSALQIGRSALFSYQSALTVVGNNISNAGDPDYTRQTPVLTPIPGVPIQEGFRPGAGVQLSALQRHIDESLEERIRVALGDQNSALEQSEVLSRIESVLNELSETDLSTLLTSFFNTFSTLQTTPQDETARGAVLATAQTLVTEIRRQRDDLLNITEQINDEIENITDRANQIVDDIATLNVDIVRAESGKNGGASGLRDQRDALLRELSTIVEIRTRLQPEGSVNVFIGNEPVVQGGISRGLTTTRDVGADIERVTVRFADDNGAIAINGGRYEGLVGSRDTFVVNQLNTLDNLARALIRDVNQVHSDGQGVGSFTDVTSTYSVIDPNLALNTINNGLEFLPRNGSFFITIKNETSGLTKSVQVDVDLDGITPPADTSLNGLVGNINAALTAAYGGASPVTASVTGDNRLNLKADPTFSFTFGHDGDEFREDSSNALAALGINTFFVGTDAQSVGVNAFLDGRPDLISAAQVNEVGDGGNAGRLSSLLNAASKELNGISILAFYNSKVSNVAVKSAAARNAVEAADVVVVSLRAEREAISGVSLDEEAINLLKFQRAFQGAAQFIRVADEMIQTMLGLVR